MSRRGSLVLLAVVAVAAGCGGSEPAMEATDKAAADVELSTYPVAWSECLVAAAVDGSCGEAELEATADDFLAAVRRLRDEGYPADELADRLRDAANDLEGACPVCVARLDRERESSG